MKEIKKILVPTDFSDVAQGALLSAGWIAHKTGAELIVLHALETYEFNTTLDNLGLTYVEILKQTVSKKLEELTTQNEQLQGLKISQRMEKGKIHKVISETAIEENCNLIVMGTHGASGISDFNRYLLGSNANRTVNVSDIPVLTIRKNEPIHRVSNILLPLDLTKTTTQKVSTAIALAKVFDATIHAITITELFDGFNPKVDQMDAKLGKVEEEIAANGIACTTASIENKDIAEGVMSYATDPQNAIDLIVIMTRQENLFNEFIPGAHSRKIIGQSPIPVLSMRPKK